MATVHDWINSVYTLCWFSHCFKYEQVFSWNLWTLTNTYMAGSVLNYTLQVTTFKICRSQINIFYLFVITNLLTWSWPKQKCIAKFFFQQILKQVLNKWSIVTSKQIFGSLPSADSVGSFYHMSSVNGLHLTDHVNCFQLRIDFGIFKTKIRPTKYSWDNF